jgi:hypothetical protein
MLSILSLCTLISRPAISQTTESELDTVPVSPNSWALQFRISPNFQLSTFQGATLGGKYHLTSATAIRGGIGITYVDQAANSETKTYTGPSLLPNFGVGSTDNYSHSISVIGQYLWYFPGHRQFVFFCGSGPIYSYSSGFGKVKSFSGTNQTGEQKQRFHGWAIGIANAVGIEWFASERFSLHAELGFSFYYSESRTIISQLQFPQTPTSLSTENINTQKNWRWMNDGAVLGLSLYFDPLF